mgnify:CR=1 FL=1
MATYIALINYTEQGIANVKESPKRLDAAKNLAASLGGEITQFFLTMGAYDAVAVAEFPDDAAAAKFLLTLGSTGNIRTTTLRAFPEAEYQDIVAALP